MNILFTWLLFNNLFPMRVDIENPILTLALAIPTGAPIIVSTAEVEMLLFVTDKTIIDLLKQ